MKWNRFFIVLVALLTMLLLPSCACEKKKVVLKLAMDPTWVSSQIGPYQDRVNGFLQDLLLELSQQSGMEFECFAVASEDLLAGLRKQNYEAILSSLPRTNYNLAEFDFSENILELGPVLILPNNSRLNSLDKMADEIVGVVAGEQTALILQRYPEVVMRSYSSIIDLLDDVANCAIEGALLDRLVAASYVHGVYSGQLNTVDKTLREQGLHLTCLKKEKKNDKLVLFEKSFRTLVKQKRLKTLLLKWGLA